MIWRRGRGKPQVKAVEVVKTVRTGKSETTEAHEREAWRKVRTGETVKTDRAGCFYGM